MIQPPEVMPPHHIELCSPLHFYICPANGKAVASHRGAGTAGEESCETFWQEKGVFMLSSVRSFRTPGLPAGLQWDAGCRPLPAPGQPQLAAIWAASSSPGRGVPTPDSLLASWQSTEVPTSDTGPVFNPRNQPRYAGNEA